MAACDSDDADPTYNNDNIRGDLMTISQPSRITFDPVTIATPKKPTVEADRKAKSDKIVADFLKEAKKTPIQRYIESILKSHNLTPEQYDALPKEQHDAIAREIAEAMRRAAKEANGGDAARGTSTDVMV